MCLALKQGDVLFNIDPIPFQSKVDSLTAQLALAQDDAERARTLLKSRNISQRDADATLTRLESLEGALETAQFELDQTTVRAPTNGYVAQMAFQSRSSINHAENSCRPLTFDFL